MIEQELEARDYYTEKNVFWVPALARWDFIKANAKVAAGTKLDVKNGKVWQYEFKGIGRLLDDALDAVEKENPRLKNVLDKDYARKRVDEALPGQLFTNTQIPACIWFLTRNKGERGSANSGSRMRQGVHPRRRRGRDFPSSCCSPIAVVGRVPIGYTMCEPEKDRILSYR